MAGECDAVLFENLAMNDVVNRLADENRRGELWTKKIVAIRHRAIPRSDMIDHPDVVKSLNRLANRENACAIVVIRQIVFERWSRKIRVAAEVMFVGVIVPEPAWIIIAKP